MTPLPRVLTVAGLDPSGGSGLLADVEAIRYCGAMPVAVCAALTAQGREWISDTMSVPAPFVEAQIQALGPVDGLKTGMLGNRSVVSALVKLLGRGVIPPPVVDPVLQASSGRELLDEEGARVLRDELLPLSLAVTPNLAEASFLTRRKVTSPAEMEDAARVLVDGGTQLVVVTGGHLRGKLVDVAMGPGDSKPWRLERERVPGTARGTGCRFAAALAARLAMGDSPRAAVRTAGDHVADYVRSVTQP